MTHIPSMQNFNAICNNYYIIGNPGSLCVTHDIPQVNYRKNMRQSLGLKICWKMAINIDETCHVASFFLSSGHLVMSKISAHAGKGAPDCLKTKLTIRLHPPEYFPAFLPISVCMRDWLLGKNDSRGRSRTVSFVFEQSGAPFPTRGLIVLVTRCLKLSTILNCATFYHDGYKPPF